MQNKLKKKVVLIELQIGDGESSPIRFNALVDVGKSIQYKKRFLATYHNMILFTPSSFSITSKFIDEYVENLEFALRDKKFDLVDVEGLSSKKGEVIR